MKTLEEKSGKDMEECAYDSKEEFLWIYVMGGCGCGSNDNDKLAWEVFELFATPHEKRKFSIYDKREYEIIAHWLDSLDWIIEHGGSISGSWLTEEGKSYMALIDKLQSDIKPTPIHKKIIIYENSIIGAGEIGNPLYGVLKQNYEVYLKDLEPLVIDGLK